jgi:hypothetical protein
MIARFRMRFHSSSKVLSPIERPSHCRLVLLRRHSRIGEDRLPVDVEQHVAPVVGQVDALWGYGEGFQQMLVGEDVLVEAVGAPGTIVVPPRICYK